MALSYFIFRNSFGPGFGRDGYGFVSFKYMRDYSNDAICIELKESKRPDAPHPSSKGYDIWYDAMHPLLDQMMQ